MTDFRSLCADLLKGLDENRHEEVRYPGHLRVVMAEARAALAQPIPVSERLPEAKDCTSNPRNGQGQWCWGWKRPGTIGTVALLFSGEWRMMRRESLTDDATHWLPYWFLPLPSEEEAP